jgi:hypothetical protein
MPYIDGLEIVKPDKTLLDAKMTALPDADSKTGRLPELCGKVIEPSCGTEIVCMTSAPSPKIDWPELMTIEAVEPVKTLFA